MKFMRSSQPLRQQLVIPYPWLRLILQITFLIALSFVFFGCVIIDDFIIDQALLSAAGPGDTASSVVATEEDGNRILGNERDLEVRVISGTVVSGEVTGGVFNFSVSAATTGTGLLMWDGPDGLPGSTDLDPTGLEGVDLTLDGTQDALVVQLESADTSGTVIMTVYTDGGNVSSYTQTITIVTTTTNFVLPYRGFSSDLGAGADFTNVGAITMLITGSELDAVIDLIYTTALVNATKTDALLIDTDNDDLAGPGDSIRYTITIENPVDAVAAPATGIIFTDTLDLNTSLVVGSVTTSQGTVTSGNTAGDTSVAVDVGSVVDNASMMITFDVTIISPLPEGVTQISNQGTVSSETLLGIKTNDPDGGASTLTKVVSPTVRATKTDLLAVDNNSNGQTNPGDVVRYTVSIENSGRAPASGVTFTDPGVTNANLVVGSVTTSQGVVNSGNTAGNTGVAVDVGIIPRNTSVTISFEVMIANPLPAGVTEISNQGSVSGTNFAAIPTDDPANDGVSDPTVTAVYAITIVDLVAIGNIVWLDDGPGGAANNGILDGDELGLAGVTVELYNAGDAPGISTPVGTTTTSGGYYEFDNLPPGTYFIHIPASQFGPGQPLAGYVSSTGSGSDEVTDQTGDENGIDDAAPIIKGISSQIYDLQPNTEVTGEDQSNYTGLLDDDNVNFTADFGFSPLLSGLDITKFASPNPVQPNGTLVYTMLVTNSGNTPLNKVVITDFLSLESRVQFVASEPPSTDVAGNRIFNLGSLSIGLTRTVMLTVGLVSASDGDTLQNIAQGKADEVAIAQAAVSTPVSIILDVPLTGLTISGPVTGHIGFGYTFTGTVSPDNATLPITYTWAAPAGLPATTTSIGGYSDSQSFTWHAPGVYVVTTTAINAAEVVVVDTHTITISTPSTPVIAPLGLTINGPTEGQVGQALTFSGAVVPHNTSTPLTYLWQAGDQATVTKVDDDSVTFTWNTSGIYTITLTVENGAGSVSATYTAVIFEYEVYLPFIVKNAKMGH